MQSITAKSLGAEACRIILTYRPEQPLRFRTQQAWPPKFESTPMCPPKRSDLDSDPAAPCIQMATTARGVQVSVFMDGKWADQECGWTVPYPDGIDDNHHYPPGTSLGVEFHAALAALVDELAPPIAVLADRAKLAHKFATELVQRAVRDAAREIWADDIEAYLDRIIDKEKLPGLNEGVYEAMSALRDQVAATLSVAAERDTITVTIKEG